MAAKFFRRWFVSVYPYQLWVGACLWLVCLGSQAFSCEILKVERYFDGKNLLAKAPYYILINKDRIVSIKSHRTKKDSSCSMISLDGMTLAPGLIDAHTHLFLTDQSYAADFGSELLRLQKKGNSVRFENGKKNAKSMLRHGFTSVRDLGNSDQYLDTKFKELVKSQKALAPRMFVSGPALVVGEGQFPVGTSSSQVKREYRMISDQRSVVEGVSALKRHGVDWIKVYADNDPNPEVMPMKLLDQVMAAAKTFQLPVAVHATSGQSARKVAKIGAQSLEHGYDIESATLKMMAKKGVVLIPTDFNGKVCKIIHQHNPDSYYHCATYSKKRKQRILNALKEGVSIGFGSDMYLDLSKEGLDRGAASLNSLMALVEHGLSPLQALRAATFTNAQLLRQNQLGVIKAGALADFVGFEKNPFTNIYNLESVGFVMKAGKVICDKKNSCKVKK